MKLFLLLTLAVTLVCAIPWDRMNDPDNVSDDIEYTWENLPHQGNLKDTPWSDSYWPSYESGIAHRWNARVPHDWEYKLLTKSELKKKTTQDLLILSPAEKYDIFQLRYDYPTVKSEWQRTSPQDPSWEGLCHGWAPASMVYYQPDYVEITNEDGITIPFGSSDVKALLIFYAAQYSTGADNDWFLGRRCYNSGGVGCDEDINAGSLHVLFENLLGKNPTGFVIDTDEEEAVWNQPVSGFKAKHTKTASSIDVEATMYYVKETYPDMKAHDPLVLENKYSYKIELDSKHQITGGKYKAGTEHPDFAWMSGVPEFHDYFQNLEYVYKKSIGERTDTFSLTKLATDLKTVKHSAPTYILKDFGGVFSGNLSTPLSANTWSIFPSALNVNKIIITIEELSTPRMKGYFKVYEGQNGQGALVAVFHSDKANQVVEVDCETQKNGSCGAYVSFSLRYNHEPETVSSFTASYEIITDILTVQN